MENNRSDGIEGCRGGCGRTEAEVEGSQYQEQFRKMKVELEDRIRARVKAPMEVAMYLLTEKAEELNDPIIDSIAMVLQNALNDLEDATKKFG